MKLPFESNDFVYTLTCTVKDKNGNTLTDKSCDGVENETFPMDGGIVVGNSIDKDDVHTYVLTLYYLDNGFDQSADMNKVLNGKVNIKDIKSINPYSENTNSLAYNIINNSMLNKNGTELVSKPLTNPAEQISGTGSGRYTLKTISTSDLCDDIRPWLIGKSILEAQTGDTVNSYNDAVGKYVYDQCSGWIYYLESYDSTTSMLTFKAEIENILTVTDDDYGTSYYYRGNVEDNYVNFAEMCWRIVRIAGDGSIKLILEDKNTTCDNNSYNGDWAVGTGNYGYQGYVDENNIHWLNSINYLEPSFSAEKSMVKAFYDFQTTSKLKDYTEKLKNGDWCVSDIVNNRLEGTNGYKPTLKCNGIILNSFKNVQNGEDILTTELPMYVGTLTADEIVYAGAKLGAANLEYYLSKSNNKVNNFYSFSLFNYDDYNCYDAVGCSLTVGNWFSMGTYYNENNMRPVILLNGGSEITKGDGTQLNPYVVE